MLIESKCIGRYNTGTSETGEKRYPRCDTEIKEEGTGKEDCPRSERRTTKIIASKQRSSVLRVCQWNVNENALKDGEDAEGINRNADDARDPVYRPSCCPT